MYSFNVIWSYSRSSCSWFLTYSSIFFAFFLLYQHNIPYTRSVGFHIYISNWHAVQISSTNFSLLNTPLLLIHCILVVFSQTYVCGLDMLPLRLSLSLFTCIVRLIYSQCLPSAICKYFFSYTLAQIQYGTYIPTSYVLNCFYPFMDTSFV